MVVLTALYAQPDGMAHPSDLCASASLSPTNVSRICDALVSREAITRVPSNKDRRRVILRITDAGDQLVRQILPTTVELLRQVFEKWPESKEGHLISPLKRLDANLALSALHDAMLED